jgi:hypothetical protein
MRFPGKADTAEILGAFVIYQVIELRISQHAVGRSLENLFDLSICV